MRFQFLTISTRKPLTYLYQVFTCKLFAEEITKTRQSSINIEKACRFHLHLGLVGFDAVLVVEPPKKDELFPLILLWYHFSLNF